MKKEFQENLSLLLASCQSLGSFDPEHLPEDFDQLVERQQLKCKDYLESQSKTLKKAVNVFKGYAGDKLDYLWESIEHDKPQLDEPTFDLLMQYAIQTHENGVLNDAYPMFCLIVAFFPFHFKAYLYLGQIIEQLAGYEEAAIFYKNTTILFKVPELLFLAANCEMQLSHEAEAKHYLEEALNGLNGKEVLSEYETELKQHIEITLSSFE